MILFLAGIFIASMWLILLSRVTNKKRPVHWGYQEHNGPHHWNNKSGYSLAPPLGGRKQSPINLDTKKSTNDDSLEEIEVVYGEECCSNIINNGHSWQVEVNHEQTCLKGGPLKDEHRLVQFHCHWGGEEGRGSEHTLDKKAFDAEMHLVHYNTKYEDSTSAMLKEDGLAVLGIFIKVGDEHEEFAKMMELLQAIQEPGQSVAVSEPIDPSAFLPGDRTYMTYPGSLTTPPLSEVVTWIIFKEPIQMSQEQLDIMRSLRCGCEETLKDNFRPTQALGDRTVRMFSS